MSQPQTAGIFSYFKTPRPAVTAYAAKCRLFIIRFLFMDFPLLACAYKNTRAKRPRIFCFFNLKSF